jgi:hypothetical protein
MKKLTRFSLVPIGYLASGPKTGGAQDDDFDLGLLPFEVVPHVFIENVSSLIREGEFDIHASATGAALMDWTGSRSASTSSSITMRIWPFALKLRSSV